MYTKHDVTVNLGWQDSYVEVVVTTTAFLVQASKKWRKVQNLKKSFQKKIDKKWNNVANWANVAHLKANITRKSSMNSHMMLMKMINNLFLE